jgi:RNA polymerase sigma factor (sigma-70 family)
VQGADTATQDDWDWAGALQVCMVETSRILRCTRAAEDAAQEALIRAWVNSRSCRSTASRSAWLSAIARREALRLLAQQRARGEREVTFETLRAEPASEFEDVGSRVDLERMLSRFGGFDLQLIRLRYFHDLAHADVAEYLGRSEGSVRVRLHRIRRQLRTRLEVRA